MREVAPVSYTHLIIGLDVTQKVISRIENGSRVVADYELDYLATALGTTINHLLGKDVYKRQHLPPAAEHGRLFLQLFPGAQTITERRHNSWPKN